MRYTHAAWLALLCCAAEAQAAPVMYQGKPVEPVCFTSLFGEGARQIDLDSCGRVKIVKGQGAPSLLKMGFLGYHYHEEGEADTLPIYIYYRLLGERKGRLIVESQYSGGGSGQFTDLSSMVLKGGRLTDIRHIAGGDRCNGGIVAAMENGVLTWTQNITAYDVVQLRGKHEHVKAYEGLDSSATGCVGTALYKEGELQKVQFMTVQGIDTAESSKARKEWEERYPMMKCFQKLRSEQGLLPIDVKKLDTFIDNFIEQCTDKP